MLLEQKDFDDDLVSLLTLFLRRLQSPVCLIAHNGFRFDFPLLKAELASIERDLPEGLLCLDSWEMFRCLDGCPVLDRSQFIVSPENSKSPPKKSFVDCNLPSEASKRKKTNHLFADDSASVGCESERDSCREVVLSVMENSIVELETMDSDLTVSQSQRHNDQVKLESYARDKSNSTLASSTVSSQFAGLRYR